MENPLAAKSAAGGFVESVEIHRDEYPLERLLVEASFF